MGVRDNVRNGFASNSDSDRQYAMFREASRSFFNLQLKSLKLGEAQIEVQDIPQLEDSLILIDDVLRNPESFGVMRLSLNNFENDMSTVIKKTNAEVVVEIRISPILLERKKLVINRLRLLHSEQPTQIQTIVELIDSLSDDGLRERLRTELESTKQTASAANRQAVQVGHAFIAMAMDPSDPALDDVLDAIKDGSAKSGVTAERIDDGGSNDPITVRMLKAIEAAEFVVVDLTNVRPNVFYEAGYAHGLGKTPIYLARKGTEIPFDVKDYPVIIYSNMRELKTLLIERLNAVRKGRE
jgi:hypothetical protein